MKKILTVSKLIWGEVEMMAAPVLFSFQPIGISTLVLQLLWSERQGGCSVLLK